MPDEITIESLQERVLELETQLNTANAEKETLSKNNNQLIADLDRARTLNQKLFERVTVTNSEEPGKNNDGEEEPLSCEEFAKKLSY